MRTFTLLTILMMTCLPLNAHARSVQKWVDENGQVHYGDFPDGKNAKTVKVPDAPRRSTRTESSDSRTETRSKLLESIQKERDDKKKAKAQSDKERNIAMNNCRTAKSRMNLLNNGGRIVEYDENGGQTFMNDARRNSELAAVKQSVNKWCK